MHAKVSVSEDLIYASVFRLLETLNELNFRKLVVPIIFIENLAVNYDKSRILFVDFKKIKSSENFQVDAIEYSWLAGKYRDSLNWLDDIGLEGRRVYHVEILKLLSLAQIFEMILKSQNLIQNREGRLLKLIDDMKQDSILLVKVKAKISGNVTDTNLFLSNSSQSLSNN